MAGRRRSQKSPFSTPETRSWYPWGDEAFEQAKALDRLLSIGYGTCHWCHVMAKNLRRRRSRRVLEQYVAIKVDGKARVDVYDRLSNAYGQRGWPLSIVTPDKKPLGGTYLPRGQFGLPASWILRVGSLEGDFD